MPKRSGGLRLATRKKLAKRIREHGKIKIRSFLQSFNSGDRVQIIIEPAYHKGMPFRRFFGKTGTIIDKRGKCYIVKIKDGEKEKTVISRPEHLKEI